MRGETRGVRDMEMEMGMEWDCLLQGSWWEKSEDNRRYWKGEPACAEVRMTASWRRGLRVVHVCMSCF